MYTSTLEADLLVFDEFDTWSIGDLIAFMSPRCAAPDPMAPEDPFSDDV